MVEIQPLPAHRRTEERIAKTVLLGSSLLALVILAWLIWRTTEEGLQYLSLDFLTNYPSRFVERAGIRPALIGSLWLAGLTMALALPLGILAGIYLNEYAKPTRFNGLIRLAIANLAGVPSVVFGLLGLALFVRGIDIPLPGPYHISLFGYGRVMIAGALTLAIMSLPIIIVATEEALKAVPRSMREAAYGLGATKWQVTKDHVLPYALPGILTGSILALSRAVGETAPLIIVGGAAAMFVDPTGPFGQYTALPLIAYDWASEPKLAVRQLSAAAIVVLLAFILLLNMTAILLRNYYQKRLKW